MVFNDLFDRRQDAVERPGRPIPAGQISVRGAAIFGSVLMVGGLVAAAFAGRASLEVAVLLAACIMCYDGGIKRTPIGPVMMGSCRFLNVLLGASGLFPSLISVLQMPQLCHSGRGWPAGRCAEFVSSLGCGSRRSSCSSWRSA